MDKKSQKIISIIIGLIISILLVVIGVRIIQRRGIQASVPENIKCTRTAENPTEANVTFENGSIDPTLVAYGPCSAAAEIDQDYPFLSNESATPQSLGGGRYFHSVIISPLVEEKEYCVTVQEYPDQLARCAPIQTETTVDATADESEEITITDPTEAVESDESNDKKSELPPDSGGSETLPVSLVNEYYDSNSEALPGECLTNFEDSSYGGQGYVCTTVFFSRSEESAE